MMIVWVLIIVTASGLARFEVTPLGDYPTIADCHVASTQRFWDEDMPLNQEVVCIRVEVGDDERN